ncbi:hypothetical protein F3Y22_tig00008013pilonHSYRG00141 [Hibiscus syriacus]|uniref:Reverse transcriptase domain-containing protein n=1 Tax=Hibiscus syriacus TaxID=106335 RepID=A0A6A3C9L9_HIBSY|nr:hypothetical protein F3Y22_tig00008013pilonHSYRG00141 [Hibiscus syriacus]
MHCALYAPLCTVRSKNELARNITIKLGYANAKIYRCEDERCPRPQCYKAYGSGKEDGPLCDVSGFENSRMKLLRHVSFVDCPPLTQLSSDHLMPISKGTRRFNWCWNIGSMSIGARVVPVKNDSVCTSKGEKIALSRRVEKHWRLIRWGQIQAGTALEFLPRNLFPIFFKKAWPLLGDEVVAAVQYFFLHSQLLPVFNSTILALVPEVPNPKSIKDFRPISCCSVIYKAITKILVKRLTNHLPDMITLNQTSFIKGRSIVENTLLAQEIVKGYGRKTISPRCSLKIDIHKTFDSLHWGVISNILRALDLPRMFIAWIEACFIQASFSISFNGSLIGYFKGARGIR